MLLRRRSAEMTKDSTNSLFTVFFSRFPWGAWSLVSLYISILSGIAVSLQYDYYTPFYSTAALDTLVPFGSFFRSLHFYSSQFSFLFACLHFIIVYHKTKTYSFSEWSKLVCSLFVLLFLLFTGYVLKADNTGISAGSIAESLIIEIPAIGDALNELLFSISASGLRKVYVQHVIALDVLLFLLLWNHLKKYAIRVSAYTLLIGATIFFCSFVAAPLEPEQLGATYISGPWFFLGLQELLRYFHPLLAGVIFPVLFFIGILFISPQLSHSRKLISGLWISLFLYLIFSLIAWFR